MRSKDGFKTKRLEDVWLNMDSVITEASRNRFEPERLEYSKR